MKSHWRMTLAAMVGVVLGGVSGFGLAAPTRLIYVVTEINEVSDAGAYEAIKAKSMQAVVGAQMADGRYIARTENIVALDGAPPKAFVMIAFSNEAKAKEYYDGEREIRTMRMNAGRSRSFIVRVCLEAGRIAADC